MRLCLTVLWRVETCNETLKRENCYQPTLRTEHGTEHESQSEGKLIKSSKEDGSEAVTISKTNRTKREESSKKTREKFSELKYSLNCKVITVNGHGAYFLCTVINAKNDIIHPITCLLDTGADPILTNSVLARLLAASTDVINHKAPSLSVKGTGEYFVTN